MPTSRFLVTWLLAICVFSPPAKPATGKSLFLRQSANVESRRPVVFVQNRGQAPADVLWEARGAGFHAGFRRAGFTLRVFSPSTSGRADAQEQRVDLVDPSRNATFEALDAQPGTINFFRGSTPDGWIRGLKSYARLRYRNIYPGIDLLFYGQEGKLEYDFVVAPGADPALIRLRLGGGRRRRAASSSTARPVKR